MTVAWGVALAVGVAMAVAAEPSNAAEPPQGWAAGPLLAAVVPDMPDRRPGEAFQVGCAGGCDLSQWQVTDGEAVHTFASGTVVGDRAWFVSDPEAWLALGMPALHGSWTALRLADAGDQLALLRPDGSIADAFAWGDAHHPAVQGAVSHVSTGLVYRRIEGPSGWQDTDSADDWRTPRRHRVGESRLDQPSWLADSATLYASPDSSHGVLGHMIDAAQRRIWLHVYELRHAELVDRLAQAALRGVDVQVLVASSPVGLDRHGRAAAEDALRRIEEAGGNAWEAQRGRYAYHHLKVLLVDDKVAVQSENWVPAGVPVDPSWGNRGWGTVVDGASIASWFAAWMEQDRTAWDTKRWQPDPAMPREAPRSPPPRGSHAAPHAALHIPGPVRVTPVVSPDHTAAHGDDPVARLLGEALHDVRIQHMVLALEGRNALGWQRPDAWVQAAVAAAQGGARVRVQVAPPFGADDDGSAEAVAWLRANGVQATEFARPGIVLLHNKGIVADDAVVVGSINGNHHSRSENREVALILRDQRAASYFAMLFDEDVRASRGWSMPGPGALALPTLFALAGVLAARPWSIRSVPPSSPW